MSQYQFFETLKQVPRIEHLWDRERRELKIELFERELGVMSSGEQHMAKFFAAVWSHENRYGFDLVDAIRVIDLKSRDLIMGWMKTPFWP